MPIQRLISYIVDKYKFTDEQILKEIKDTIEKFIQVFDDKGEISHIEIDDILYLDVGKDVVKARTKEGLFRSKVPHEYLENFVQKHSFTYVDRNTYARLDKIVQYDSVTGTIFFDSTDRTICLQPTVRSFAKIKAMIDNPSLDKYCTEKEKRRKCRSEYPINTEMA